MPDAGGVQSGGERCSGIFSNRRQKVNLRVRKRPGRMHCEVESDAPQAWLRFAFVIVEAALSRRHNLHERQYLPGGLPVATEMGRLLDDIAIRAVAGPFAWISR